MELPAALSRLDPAAREVVSTAFLEFCKGHWPPRHLSALHSYACEQRYASRHVESEGSFTWPTDGQYYVHRSGSEYFLHRNLLEFLRCELRVFAVERKGEVLSHLPLLFDIGDLLFVILDAVESELRKGFESVKAFEEIHYCLPVSKIPIALLPDVIENAQQRREWKNLYGVVVPRSARVDVAHRHPMFVVDTRHFSSAFVAELSSGGALREEELQGMLVHGDNLDAMRTLLPGRQESVRCIYIDPPYNTGTSSFLYRDRYPRGNWLSMMDNRLELAREFLTPDGSLFVQIDYAEKERLRMLLDRHYTYQTEIIWRIGWISGFKAAAKKFIRNHDTIYHVARTVHPFFRKNYIPYPHGYTRRDGSPPSGRGYPLEDTWNCSEIDRLDSIQIMSFSREKVGAPALTQKNENLLERIIVSTTEPGDTVMDFFAGTGTTCAVAHKMGRRWIGDRVWRLVQITHTAAHETRSCGRPPWHLTNVQLERGRRILLYESSCCHRRAAVGFQTASEIVVRLV